MAVTIIDDFTGTNGAALDAAKWNVLIDSGAGPPAYTGSATIQNNKARFTSDGGYHKVSAESVATFTNGEVRADATLVTDLDMIALGFAGSSPYNAAYALYPINGYLAKVLMTGTVRFESYASETMTLHASVNLAAFAVGDVVHLACRAKTDGVDIWVWRNAEARPTTATISSTVTTYQGGEVRPSFQSGAATSSVDWDDIVWDDLGSGPDITATAPGSSVWNDTVYPTVTGTNYTSVSWSLTVPAGSTATLTNATTTAPSYTPDKVGTYTATVTATGTGGSTSRSVSTVVRGQFMTKTATGKVPLRWDQRP